MSKVSWWGRRILIASVLLAIVLMVISAYTAGGPDGAPLWVGVGTMILLGTGAVGIVMTVLGSFMRRD